MSENTRNLLIPIIKEKGLIKIIYSYLDDNIIQKYNGDWLKISKHKYLDEEFINMYDDVLDWYHMSKYQKLSLNMIDRHLNEVNWFHIMIYQGIPDYILLKKYHLYLNPRYLYFLSNRKL